MPQNTNFLPQTSKQSIAQSQNNPSFISLQTLIYDNNYNYKLTIITINKQ